MSLLAAFNGSVSLGDALPAAVAPAAKAVAKAAVAAAANATKAAAAGGGLDKVVIGWQGIVVCVTLGLSLIVMGMDAVGPDLVFGALASIYAVSGIITVKEAAAGFANTGVLTVLALYAVAEGVSQTGGLDILMSKVLGRASSVFWAQVRMMIPVMISSAFLNNTPIVALLIPILLSWSRRCNVPAKKLLIPLSFATVLGGTMTVIGTSTNLVVSGLQAEMAKDDPTIPVFGFFTITPYGVPYAAWGMAYILLFSWLLPGHEGAGHTDLISELAVADKDAAAKLLAGPLARSPLMAGLGTSRVIAVRTPGGTIAGPAVAAHTLGGDDVVIVQGSARDNSQLALANGLEVLAFEGDASDLGAAGGRREDLEGSDGEGGKDAAATDKATALAQVLVAPNAPIIGRSIRDTGFRGRFDAAVIAVKRGHVKQGGRLGDVVLRKGDILVLSVGSNFDPKAADFSSNFKKLKYLDQTVQREYTTAMRVTGRSLVGRTITQAGLRGVTGLFLFELHRSDGQIMRAVAPDTVLHEDDTLFFAGDLASVSFLMKFEGLEHQQKSQLKKLPSAQVDRQLVQAVVGPHSELVHKTVRDVRFRHTYGAALLSVHRSGQSIIGDIANVKLQSGDVLVLETGPEFPKLFAHSPAFALISTVPNSAPVKRNRMWIALLIVAALISTQIYEGASGKDLVHLWPASMIACGLMLAFKCMNATQARDSMDWEVFMCIAFAFAVSTAMEKTKVALGIAEVFAALSARIGGSTAALTSMYLVTALLSELLTNNAAAAIMCAPRLFAPPLCPALVPRLVARVSRFRALAYWFAAHRPRFARAGLKGARLAI
ncbi:sodium sulfate co-transporter [Raphidocelis subcapitata]|uniref:Sodium sulfate co-transporter n=1 Tax=Raphidocelis subcapitata TaxID=307507 RepID=A0A2V0NW17_9CHLO|nr:sodium sulfate co-transporter [Raphidocelis subcapitata]|eukprot:GBF89760.1 sodium sulfate co-transporter [Raphidocelis subcapitata]